VLTPPAEAPPVTFPVDPALAGRLREAARLVRKQTWPDAIRVLREVIESPDDALFPATDETADGSSTWTAGNTEAARLLRALPLGVQAEFKRAAEPAAQELLRRARASDEVSSFLAVISRYPFSAGLVVATRLAERGQYHAAATRFAPLLNEPERADKLTSLSLYHATIAFCTAGDAVHAESAWKRLAARHGEKPVRVEGRLLRLDELKQDVQRVVPATTTGAADWPLYRGNPSRSAPARGGTPHLQPRWSVSTLPNPAEPYLGKDAHRAWLESYLKAATTWLEESGLPVLPAFHPIACNGRILFRNYDGIFAIDLRERDPRPEARHVWQSTDGGVSSLLSDPNKKASIDRWMTRYLESGPRGVLFEDSLIGNVSSDGQRAFIIDDLMLPPVHEHFLRLWAVEEKRPNFGRLNELAYHNSLKVFDLDSFKLTCDLGRPGHANMPRDSVSPELEAVLGLTPLHGPPADGRLVQGNFFLGPPLPLDGRIYVLHERAGTVQLLCLAFRDTPTDRLPPAPELVWSLPLLSVRDPIMWHPLRRIHAAQLAYRDGILICPTNAGAVVGVEIATQRVIWVYRYGIRPRHEGERAALVDEWKASAPAISEGKVIFTSPDSLALQCLDLRDGRLLWQARRAADDCYFAGVHDGKVLIVARNSVRALDLTRGIEVWKRDDTGMPSGQGVATGSVYYLPVKTKEPGIVAIDLKSGAITARIRAADKDAGVGNLIFYDDQLLSQTLTSLTSYPLVKPAAR
jgi:hypothetical protein